MWDVFIIPSWDVQGKGVLVLLFVVVLNVKLIEADSQVLLVTLREALAGSNGVAGVCPGGALVSNEADPTKFVSNTGRGGE